MIGKRLTLLVLFWLFAMATTLHAQQITNYSFAASAGTFTALSSPTYLTLTAGNTDDGYFNGIPIGFDFWYMGTPYTTISASTNGWLTLGATITNSTLTNSLSAGGAPRPVIAPLWDDISIQAASNVSYQVTGNAPNRVFTIQYLNTKWRYYATGNTISFQTNLYEGTGKIEFIYRRESGSLITPSASIGITAAATGSGNFLSVNNAGTGVSSTVQANVTSKPVTGRTFAFTPLVPTAPGSLTFSSVSTASMTLNWSDLSSNETGFYIYRSTDGVNYSLVSQTVAGATTSVQSGLASSTTYYWKVYAAAEGGMSVALSGSQSTESDEVGWYNAGWLYRKAITVDYTKVADGPLTDFPLLISRVDADLQTRVQTDADDILFTAANGTTKLSHEIESYTDASGALVAWVKVPTLSSSTNTIIYMYYGNSVATNQQHVAGTWETNFKGVYHLNNSFIDATSNAYDGTNTGTANVAGQIANGSGYTAGNKITIAGEMGNPANVTLSAWVNLTSLSSSGSEVVSVGDHIALRLANMTSALDIVSFSYNGSGWNNTVSVYGVTGWHYVATTFDDAGNSQRNYLDGTLVTPTSGGTYAASIDYDGLGANTIIGDHGNGGSNFSFRGTLDEVRVTGTTRSAGWLWTEYNNQNAPATFYNVGSEENSTVAKIFAGTGNFSDAARWTGGILPVAGENIVIDGTCTVDNYAGTDNVAYGSLIIGTATGRTLNWAVGGTNRLNVMGISAGAGTGALDMTNGGTLIIRGTSSATNLSFTPGAGTIEMQTSLTLPAVYPTFNNLSVNGTGITVSLSTATVLTGNLTIINGTLNSNNYDLTVGNNWTNNASTTAYTAGTASVILNGTAAQAIGGTFATTFNNLNIAHITDTVSLHVNASLSGNLSVASGTFDLAGFSANRTSAGGILTLADDATLRIGGNSSFPANFTTNTLEATSTVEYAGPTQTVKGISYGNLIISGAGSNSKTADGNMVVNGVLNLSSNNASATQGCLEMGTYTLTMGASATTIGPGDVTGIVRRTSFLANIEYSFGNQFTTIDLLATGTFPSEIQVKITLGTSPSWKTTAVNRIYEFIQTGGINCRAILEAHYGDNELNGNTENELVLWGYGATPPLIGLLEYGRSNNNYTDNWVSIANVPLAMFPSNFGAYQITMANSEVTSYTWNGSQSTDWGTTINWTPSGIPSSTHKVIIPDASTTLFSPTLPASTEIKYLTLEAGGVLNSISNEQFTINGGNGAWSNTGGTFNPSTSNVIFTSSAATISGTTNFYNITLANTAGLTPGTGNIMRIAGTLALEGSGILRAVTLHNTIEYNGADQTVINPNGLTPGYHNLILSGSGTKSMPGIALSIAEDFSLEGSASATSGDSLSVGGNVTMATGTTLNLGTFNHTIAGNLTNNGGTLTSLNSSITFNGSAPQTIASSDFLVNDLNITNTSAEVVLGPSTNCSIGGNLTVDAGAVFNLAANSLNAVTGSVSSSGTIKTQSISSAPVPAGKTWDGSFEFTGNDAQTIVSGTYNNLIMSGSGGATADTNITVNGILDLSSANPSDTKGILDMGIHTVLMGSLATTTGPGDVTGIVRRTTILPDVTYSFGNQFSTMNFPNIGTLPTEISVKINIGTAPSWKPDAIKRIYDIIHVGGDGTRAFMYCHYLDSELNENNEEKLVDWLYFDAVPLVMEYGRSAFNLTDKWVAMADVQIGFFATSFGEMEVALAESKLLNLTWNGSASTVWTNVSNWTPNGAPSDITAVTIPDAATTAFDPIVPTVATCNTITIENGGILNAMDSARLTITGGTGAWSKNEGVFNAGTSTVIFKNSGATMSGSTDFNNLTIDTNATLELQTNSYLGITGMLTNNGALGTVESGTTTVEYKGGDQDVVTPTTNSYSTLILSGTGTKIMPVTALTIEGDFLLSDTVSATAVASIVVGRDMSIDSSSTFITGIFNHFIGGHFSNNGTFTAVTGNTITMNGTSIQAILGSVSTSFDNLIINNNRAVDLFSNIIVNGELTLSSGNLYVGGSTISINGSISKTSGTIEVVTQSSMIFGGTGSLTLDNNLFSTAPSIHDLTINRAGGVVLGNQNMRVNGLLDLSAGTLSLAANSLTITGHSPTRTSGMIDAGNTGATLVFANDTAIILPASIFAGDVDNLTITGDGGITASSDFTINGILYLQSANPSTTKGSLDMWDGSTHHILNMNEDATTIGVGDVTGIVSRTSTFVANKPYTFGNQFTKITFSPGGTFPTQLQSKTTIGTSPSWKPEAIKRIDDFIQTGGSGCFVSVVSHYLNAELNGNNEETLVRWKHTPPSTIVELGRTDYDTTDNWVMNANIGIANFPSSFGTERTSANSELVVLLWNGSVSTDWVTMENWTPRSSPSSLSYISIPDTSATLYSPTLPASTEIKTLKIEADGILNAPADAELIINGDIGAWTNDGGTFNHNTSNVIFTGALATLSGVTNFYNVTINAGKGLRMEAESIMRIAGTLSNDGILNTTDHAPTIVEYNGTSAQSMGFANPTTFYNLIIENTAGVTLTSDALTTVLGDLTISSGTSFEMASGTQLAATGTITNVAGESGLILHSDATGTASLIHNSDSVPATMECYMGGAAEAWHFISSPVSDQEISGPWLPSGTYGNGTGYDLYVWNEVTNCWIYHFDSTSTVNWSTVHPGADFETARGYLYAVQISNPTREFAGNLHNGPVSIALSASGPDASLEGFNLAGNPYPSAVDWAASSGWDRDVLKSSGGGYDMWIWNPAATNYGVYNSADADGTGTNSVTGTIAPMQGYFVQAATAGYLEMNNEVRVLGTGNWLKSMQQEISTINIGVKSDASYGSDEVELGFGYDENENGAMKLFSRSSSAPSLYLASGGMFLSVFYLTNTEENSAVPVKFTPGMNGDYTLTGKFNPNNFETILLEDRKMHVIHNLKSDTTYSFTASVTDDANRFVLHFGPVSDQPVTELPAKIYAAGNRLILDLTLISKETDATVYDIMGRLLWKQKLQGKTTHEQIIESNTQLVIVNLVNEDGSLSQKLFWTGNQ